MLVIAAGGIVLTAGPATAATRQVSSGNYYFQDGTTGSRMQIVVKKGDQLVVTIAQAPVADFLGAHTVDVDEMNIHSEDLALGQTFTTPPLNKTGNFLLYCDNHRDRGHTTRLIVQAPAASATPKPTGASGPASTHGDLIGSSQDPVPLTADPIPLPALTAPPLIVAQPTLAPVGVGQADEIQLEAAGVDPDSLEGLIGRNLGGNQPWTRALWFTLIAAVAVIGVAIGAVVRGARLAGAAPEVAASKRRGTAASSSGRPRSSGRSGRSSRPKASASAQKSGGRRR
jgi:hypothetical protein